MVPDELAGVVRERESALRADADKSGNKFYYFYSTRETEKEPK